MAHPVRFVEMIFHKNHGAKCVGLSYARSVWYNQVEFVLAVKKQSVSYVMTTLHQELVIYAEGSYVKTTEQRKMNRQYVTSVGSVTNELDRIPRRIGRY